MDLRLDQLSLTVEAAATALDDRPLIDFCRSPEAVVALRSGSGPLVDLLTNTPEANRKAVAKLPDEVRQVSCSRPAGSGLRWSLLGLMLRHITVTLESGHWGFRGPCGSACLTLSSVSVKEASCRSPSVATAPSI